MEDNQPKWVTRPKETAKESLSKARAILFKMEQKIDSILYDKVDTAKGLQELQLLWDNALCHMNSLKHSLTTLENQEIKKLK